MPRTGDALLTPTLTDHRPRDFTGTEERPPWAASSLVYGAILGGPLALMILASIDAKRLRAPRGTAAKILAITGVCLLVAVVLEHLIGGDAARLIVQASGLVAFGGVWLLLRSPDRVHSVFSPNANPDDDHESVFAATVGAVFVAFFATEILRSIVAEVL